MGLEDKEKETALAEKRQEDMTERDTRVETGRDMMR